MAGELMAAEIRQQAQIAADLVGRRQEIISTLRAALPTRPNGLALLARGASDHAGRFGRYVLEASTRRPVVNVAPSLVTLYRIPTDYSGWLAVACSQSGETPEIVTALQRLQEFGAVGVAVTNHAESPLASAADVVIDLGTGREEAIPATKTFLAQLFNFAFLAEALGDPGWTAADWEAIPAAVREIVNDPGPAERAAVEIGRSPGVICVARGYLLGVALETALILKETTSIHAEGFSSADLLHGPIAIVESGIPVLSFRSPGPTDPGMLELEETLRLRGARLFSIGPHLGSRVPIPAGFPEPLSAILAAVRAQQLALSLALVRGLDPDRPHGLTKVTRT